MSKHLTDIDNNDIMKTLPQVQQADKFMENAREIQQTLGATSKSLVVARGNMERGMVEYALGKMPKVERDKTSVEAPSRELCGHAW